MNELTQQVVEEHIAGTHKSRWGYHPCSYETFRKIKRLAAVVRKAERTCSHFRRWFRKSPHNRMSWPAIRNEKGWKIGYSEPSPIPEPTAPEELVRKTFNLSTTDINGVKHESPVTIERLFLTTLARDILWCRATAPSPVQTQAEVKSLPLSERAIDELYAQFCEEKLV